MAAVTMSLAENGTIGIANGGGTGFLACTVACSSMHDMLCTRAC